MIYIFVCCVVFILPLTSVAKPLFNETTGKWQYGKGDKPNTANQLGSQRGRFEGDILGIPKNGKVRNGIPKAKRWETWYIPYQYNSYFSSSEKANVNSAMRIIEDQTCIRFIPRTTQSDYIYFENTDSGCYSYVGKVGGPQIVSLQRGTFCTDTDSIIHELLHAAGLYHEHSRYDRDPYLKINLANVRAVGNQNSNVYGAPFDYDSIMLYQAYAAAINPRIPVMITTDKSKQNTIGKAAKPSDWDYFKINRIYDCATCGRDMAGDWCTKYASYCSSHIMVYYYCFKTCKVC